MEANQQKKSPAGKQAKQVPNQAQQKSPAPLPPPIRAGVKRVRQAKKAGATSGANKRPVFSKKGFSGGGRKGKIRRELSAGGVAVRQEKGEWLVALAQTEHKRGLVWVLPKGHVEVDEGERASAAARREVEEEVGLKDLSVKDQLGVTRFKFQVEDGVVHKTVHYFLMATTQKILRPQADEGLLDARWFTFDEAMKALEYDTDQEVVWRGMERITGKSLPKPKVNEKKRGTGGGHRGSVKHDNGEVKRKSKRGSTSGISTKIHL